MDRRHFLALGAIGALRTSTTFAARARFQLGVGTYTFRGVSIDTMIRRLVQLRIRHVELSSPDFMLPRVEVKETLLLRDKFRHAGIRAVSYYCGTIKTEEDVEGAVQVASILRSRHISGTATGDALTLIDRRFPRAGLTFGLHNHWFRGRKFEHESPEDLMKAVEGLSPAVGITLDTGHMASCGYDPVEALAKVRRRLKAVHLKDVARAGDDKNVILGAGVARSAAVIDELKRQGFRGLVAIEYEEGRDPDAEVQRCLTFARSRM